LDVKKHNYILYVPNSFLLF